MLTMVCCLEVLRHFPDKGISLQPDFRVAGDLDKIARIFSLPAFDVNLQPL